MEYVAVIRTLGCAGNKYQTLLNSLSAQTIRPKEIIVYIAEGYPIPRETIGFERYIYVHKGMMAQRALNYDEVDAEYMLFLDDDLYLPENSVEEMFRLLKQNNADVISPDIFPNADRSRKSEIIMTISARMRARYKYDGWGYKVMRNGGYSYFKFPEEDVLFSETNAGACFLCRKSDFVRMNYQDENWIDAVPYALGDDQVIYYKMHLNGLRIITWYTHGLIHLDGGQNYLAEKERSLIYSDFRFKMIFWHRFIYKPEKNRLLKVWNCLTIGYSFVFSFVVSLLKLRFDILKVKYSAIKDGISFIRSKKYKSLPLI